MIVDQSETGKAADAIQAFTGFERALGDGDHFTERAAPRSDGWIRMQHGARDRRGQLDVRQVEWRIEHVEWAIAELVIRELSAFQRILFVHDDEAARHGHGANRVIHDAAAQHWLRW